MNPIETLSTDTLRSLAVAMAQAARDARLEGQNETD